MAEKQSPLERLRTDLAEDGRLHNSRLTPLTAHDETLLKNLTSKYVLALQDNIASCFKDSLPILSAFKIFDPVAVPPKSEQSFSDYGISRSLQNICISWRLENQRYRTQRN